MKTYSIGIVLLTGCTATQVRWDATNIREQVMVYYNDQIMDNLIRAKYNLPFVHVDITLLTSQGMSQISGTIGAGENRTSMHTSRSAGDALGTLSRAVMRPFAFSVTPQQTETLSIAAAPALGPQALASPSPEQSDSPSPSPDQGWEESKKTIVKDGATIEETRQKPKTITIYDLYDDFLHCKRCEKSPLVGPKNLLPSPGQDQYVQGTLKIWQGRYYYIDRSCQQEYYKFCKRLFTKGQAGSLEKALQQVQASATLR